MTPPVLFSTIEVGRQVFHRTALAAALVNLKPLVPGHVLVIPTRVVPRMADLSPVELGGLMDSVQRVGRVLERAYGASALTIACQDGAAAGQSIPHVHFHLMPRGNAGDKFAGNKNDDIYPALEKHEKEGVRAVAPTREGGVEQLRVDADEDRKPRTPQEMETEAAWLQTFFEEQD